MIGASIVLPVYNALDDARACVESIYACQTAIPFDIILVNNGSRADVAEWVDEQQALHSNLTALHFVEPLGFAGAMNEGARLATHESLVLLNSDTLVTDHWLDPLVSAIVDDPALGIVSPITNLCGHAPQRDPDARALAPEDARAYAKTRQHRSGIVLEPQRLTFFCVAIRRTLWNALGGLDEIYGAGNFEDDDFCLHARLAGHRMAVVRSSFVFHREGRTFAANNMNHGELLAKNQAIFGARARSASVALREPLRNDLASAITVILPVTCDRLHGLQDSLASLCNQTVQGFEVVIAVADSVDIAAELSLFANHLRLKTILVNENLTSSVADFLNAATKAASASILAYLCAADIYYPFHLEVMLDALIATRSEAVHCAWSVVLPVDGIERRDRVEFHEAAPGLALGDWAPIVCWMHRRTRALPAFDPIYGSFAPWAFLLEALAPLQPHYLDRVTCERTPDRPTPCRLDEATRVMQRFPVFNSWQLSQRSIFLEGISKGVWEEHLIIVYKERARRARRLAGAIAGRHPNVRELALIKSRLDTAALSHITHDSLKPDIILFSTIEWTSLTQRPHHFAAGLAARGHRIFWVDVHLHAPETVTHENLVQHLSAGIYQMNLPAIAGEIYSLDWHPKIVDAMLACFDHIRTVYGITSATQLVNFPRWQPIVSALQKAFGWPIVYDCLDDQQAFATVFGHTLDDSEHLLIDTAAQVIVSSQTLLNAKQSQRPDALLVTNAADYRLFRDAMPDHSLGQLPRPIVGFFGAFADWLDLDWISAAAERFPTWSFVYIGREGFSGAPSLQRWKRCTSAHANIHVFPQAPPPLLARYLAAFDVAIMPFLDTAATRSMNAVKLYEYLAAGKPVVAVDLPETHPLAQAGLIATYRTKSESFCLLEDAVAQGNDLPAVKKRQAFAAANAWSDRIEQLSSVMALTASLSQESSR